MIDYSYSEFESDMDDRINSYRGKRERLRRALMKRRKSVEKRLAKEHESKSKE
jgi:hypothetical protein